VGYYITGPVASSQTWLAFVFLGAGGESNMKLCLPVALDVIDAALEETLNRTVSGSYSFDRQEVTHGTVIYRLSDEDLGELGTIRLRKTEATQTLWDSHVTAWRYPTGPFPAEIQKRILEASDPGQLQEVLGQIECEIQDSQKVRTEQRRAPFDKAIEDVWYWMTLPNFAILPALDRARLPDRQQPPEPKARVEGAGKTERLTHPDKRKRLERLKELYQEGKTQEEAAEALDVSVTTVKRDSRKLGLGSWKVAR
jgi:hypothetical protein